MRCLLLNESDNIRLLTTNYSRIVGVYNQHKFSKTRLSNSQSPSSTSDNNLHLIKLLPSNFNRHHPPLVPSSNPPFATFFYMKITYIYTQYKHNNSFFRPEAENFRSEQSSSTHSPPIVEGVLRPRSRDRLVYSKSAGSMITAVGILKLRILARKQ